MGSVGVQPIARGKCIDGLPAKNLMGQPWRAAFALQDDGWILRSAIVWHKPNPMPESVSDRPTSRLRNGVPADQAGALFLRCRGRAGTNAEWHIVADKRAKHQTMRQGIQGPKDTYTTA